jgi:esterase/lipase
MKYSKEVLGKGHKDLVIIFPHWQAQKFFYFWLARALSKNNCVLLYSYTGDILSSDISKTLKNFQTIRDDADAYIENNKYKKVSVVGYSTGSFLSFLLAKKNQKISKIATVSIASRFSDVIWHNIRHYGVSRIKKELVSRNISQDELEKAWRPISPEDNLDKIKAVVLLILSEGDKTVKYKFALELLEKIKTNKINCQIITRKYLPHSLAVFISLLKIARIVKFVNNYEQD